MAKKQISYGPDTALILGEKQVAESEAMKDTLGGRAFVQGLTGSVLSGIQEQEKRNAKMDAHLDNLGGIQNINLLDEDYNKQAVTNFVRSGRDEYAKLAASYEKTKDRATLDKMDAIKFSFNNLNTQLQALVGERKAYLSAYDKGQLVTLGNGDEKYTDMYTNNSQFSVEASGDIGFGSGDGYSKFKDNIGKWNVSNNIYKNSFLQLDAGIVANASKGGRFDEVGVTNQISSLLNAQGVEEAQVAFKTDVIGDENMIIGKDKSGNNILAGNLSFEAIWSKGGMDPKFYEGYTPDSKGNYDTKWMFEDKNSKEGVRLKSMYDANVLKDRHEKMFKEKESNKNRNPRSGKLNLGKSRLSNETIYMQPQFVNNKINEFQNAKKGDFISGFEGANTYGFEFDGKDFIYKQYNPETREFEGDKKYNMNDAVGQFVPSHYLSGGVSSAAGFNK